jgi:Gluconate 2-dehydrogenase subunit 3
MQLTRRELLDLAVRAAALSGAADFFAAWFRDDYQPTFFDAEDFAALQAFTEILIPTDDTPGAREARCAHFIDFVLQAATGVQPELQQQWRDALGALRAAGFHAADAKGREAIVEAMSRPERDRAATHPAYQAYRLIKQQNAFAFFTSRAGMIETLDYRGNSYNATFPACTHPEHRTIHGSGV